MKPEDAKEGMKVTVNHPRFRGEGFVVGIIPKPMLAVKIGNGNIWYYEADTVTPIKKK